MSGAIYWFRNDLRVQDNEGFRKAVEQFDEVVPLYVLDEEWLKGKQFGIERMGPHRLKFLLESIQDLKQTLQTLGSDVHFQVGKTVEVIDQVRREFNCNSLMAQKASAYEEVLQEVEASRIISSEFVWGETLYHIDDLNFHLDELPGVFTKFRKSVEKRSNIREVIESPLTVNSPQGMGAEIPSLEELGFENPMVDERAVLHFKGGATAAMERLNYYLWEKELLANYKETRNGLIGGDYSSKFSPWLANGCLSPRQIYWQIKKFEKYVKKNSSTGWFLS